MPIVNTVTEIDSAPQPDGSRFVVETHTDNAGNKYTIGPWTAGPGFDVAAHVTARIASFNVQLAEKEADAILQEDF